ncbi:MAG: cupin domain-containing protein [Chloroflexi bacterium]|nr:cupin domain-containing protein [Chloroflexota bacterium]
MALPILSARDVPPQPLGDYVRRVLFGPGLGNSRYLRMAVVTAAAGARSVPHSHHGNEGIFTWQGAAVFEVAGQEYPVGPGQALLIPPETVHPARIVGAEPWVAVCFYCNECPALAAFLAAGGSGKGEQPAVVGVADVQPELLGQLRRRILVTPARDGVSFMRIGHVEGLAGARGAVHKHLGNECVFTLAGQATVTIMGEPHVMDAGCGMSIPPDTEHPLTVSGADGWTAVAAYCDECPALRK